MKLTTFLFFLLLLGCEIALSKEEIWNYSNGNYQGHKFSSLNKINTTNVGRLNKAWSYKNGFIPSVKNNSQIIPIFTGTSIITSSVDGYLISINPSCILKFKITSIKFGYLIISLELILKLMFKFLLFNISVFNN